MKAHIRRNDLSSPGYCQEYKSVPAPKHDAGKVYCELDVTFRIFLTSELQERSSPRRVSSTLFQKKQP